MGLDPNSAVFLASKHFLRTREGFHFAPTIQGFARHIEATMRLYEAVVPNNAPMEKFMFAVWRQVLVAVSDVAILINKARRVI